MWYVWERREKYTRFWWESPKEYDYLDDRSLDGRMESEWTLVNAMLSWQIPP
jgi:hypothetical protein